MAAAIPGQRYADRLARVHDALTASGADAMLIGVGPELEWLTGYDAHGLERLNLLVLRHDRPDVFVGPRLEVEAARSAPGLGSGEIALVSWSDGEDPYRLVAPLLEGRSHQRSLVDDGLRAAFLLGLQAILPDASWGSASAALAPIRRVKDADEVALLRSASRAADRAMARVIAGPLVGRTEAEVARDVRDALVDEGHDTASFAIVASGPNSASPHHAPGARRIQAGEPLLFDIGGRRAGYCSDITRTIWVAGSEGLGPDSPFIEIYELTAAAQAAARASVRPGVSLEAIDAAAREIITAGGHGDRFIHRLGHGIGLEVHEEPYAVAGNTELAMDGVTITCEPGIYLEGRYGVRIEDVVVCRPSGGEALNEAPRDLLIVSG